MKNEISFDSQKFPNKFSNSFHKLVITAEPFDGEWASHWWMNSNENEKIFPLSTSNHKSFKKLRRKKLSRLSTLDEWRKIFHRKKNSIHELIDFHFFMQKTFPFSLLNENEIFARCCRFMWENLWLFSSSREKLYWPSAKHKFLPARWLAGVLYWWSLTCAQVWWTYLLSWPGTRQ